ncbi:hypothetical protein FQN60_013549 [Etheostoma spectabile]|uniref:Mediator of RNA polymerase II transcription subunit 1 n=1 Tax=Etheostoma spectabile TaxID=54343 RepID=A0A5J5CKF8_9PERO|nr:hypothetical protein FQN60_013549 [Etheostoma spectabile]
MDSIPFTHPGRVPALLDLLRHQCAFNTLLRSCITSQCAGTGSACDLHFEVLPESETSFSVTFHRPDADSLGCILLRFMSIPITLRTLYSKLEKITSAPLSPSRPATTEAENDRSAPSSTAVTDTNGAITTLSQSAAVPEDSFSVSGSSCCAISVDKSELSELLPEIKTSPAVNPYPYDPVGKGSSSISSDISSSTDHTPTKAPKNVATTEDGLVVGLTQIFISRRLKATVLDSKAFLWDEN